MLKLRQFLIPLSMFLCHCSEPVNTADKETQLKQLDKASREFFIAVYRKDTTKLEKYFADEVILKPHHFFFKNLMGRVAEESRIELKVDRKTHISYYDECVGDENNTQTDEEILNYFNELETEIILYDEDTKIKEIVFYTPSFYTNEADMKAKKEKTARIEFQLKKGDALFRIARKTLKEDGGAYFQFRYFSDGWKIVAEFQ